MEEGDARKTRRWFGVTHGLRTTPHHLRVLRASASFICAEILPLRCCGRMIADVLTGPRCTRRVMRSQPWKQAKINRSKPL
jgi:hypothetical protein